MEIVIVEIIDVKYIFLRNENYRNDIFIEIL